MKISIDNDFPVTVLNNYVNVSPSRRVLITARTRAGKTTLLCHLAAKVMLQDQDNICFIIGPNLGSFCEDVVDKFEGIPQLAKYSDLLDIRSIRDTRTAEMVANQFSYVYQDKPFITVINADHIYVKKILALIQAASIHQPNRRIVVFLDEAHKSGEKTYDCIKSTLMSLSNRNVSLVETTATYMNRLLSVPAADVQILVPRHGIYVDPTAAELISFARSKNNDCMSMSNPRLHEEHLDQIALEFEKPQSLTLVSGNQSTAFHEAALHQCLALAKQYSFPIAIVKINSGTAWYIGNHSNTGKIVTAPDSIRPVRAASSIVSAIYREGYKHIIVIGHKQVEMGQTIGCADISMSLQILMVAKKAPKADNIAQWVRTGGNGVGIQSIMCPAEIWEDYLAHVKVTEELSISFSGLSGDQQQAVAESLYVNRLKHLTQDFGDYAPFSVLANTENIPTITWLSTVYDYPAHFKEGFEYIPQSTRDTSEIRRWVAAHLKAHPCWNSAIPMHIRTCSGDINTRKRQGGNDIQVYVNADPEADSGQAWQRNITVWIRHTDSALCIRVRPALHPRSGAVHDYYGKLRYPKSAHKTQLVLL